MFFCVKKEKGVKAYKRYAKKKMFIVFYIFWIVFNGRITFEILWMGAIISAVIYAFICKYMNYSIKKDIFLMKKILFFCKYFLVLIWEIIKANIDTVKLILSRRYMAEPVVVKFQSDLKTDMANVLLANSITLTPGTITVSLNKNEFVIHCLDKDFSEGLKDSIFVKMLRKLEEMEEKNDVSR